MTNRLSTMSLINADMDLREKHKKVFKLLWEVFAELVSQDSGEKREFDITSKEEAAQKFMYEYKVFGSHQVPFNEWADIADEGLQLLKKFIESDMSDYRKLPGYQPFIEKVGYRLDALVKDPRYSLQLSEWMND